MLECFKEEHRITGYHIFFLICVQPHKNMGILS